MEMNLDRISNLPGHVINRILSFLPIKDAVKTSVLSTKWRYEWETVPSLVFNNRSLPVVIDKNGIAMIDKLVMDIYRVLVLHSGPIEKFVLSYEQNLPSDEIDKWIRYLSRHPLSKFLFKISNKEGYKMPSFMFSCQTLMCLELTNCLLRPPSTFNGFENLKNLDLESVTVAQDVLECLISSSPVLRHLILSELKGLNQLNVDAPNLLYFYLNGQFVESSLNCTNLEEFCVNFDCSDDNENGQLSNHANLVKLMAEITQIKRLTIGTFSLEHLVGGDIPTELPLPCPNLYFMSIDIDFNSCDETLALLCLLRSAPNLQELHVTSYMEKICETSADVWETDRWNCPFTRLRCVNLKNFSGVKVEIDFIKFMLLTALVLERMVVKLSKNLDDNKKVLEIVRQVCRLKRASPLAEINILDP